MSLQDQLDRARGEIKTDRYSMSIGEWINLYQDEEIDIHPEFQRFFRWDNFQKTRFIESILLGLPIPPIFVAQSEDGTWDVVDGLQRLSTIFEFAGILKDDQNNTTRPLVLESTKYLPSLEGKKWEIRGNNGNSFTMAQRLFIKRAKLDVNIILRESYSQAKYELFQRLNTGGSPLSDQEVRNCIIVMQDKEFYEWLRELSANEDFQNCISITDRGRSEQYDVELALRFILFRMMMHEQLTAITDVGEFITEQMIEFMDASWADPAGDAESFNKTFEYLNQCVGPNAFRRFNNDKGVHQGGFLVSAFEAVALGIGYHIQDINAGTYDVSARIVALWNDDTFKNNSGAGVRGSYRIPKLVEFGREHFKP